MSLKATIRMHIINNEGFSYNLQQETPTEGYMVGGFSKVIELKADLNMDYHITAAIQRYKMIKELSQYPPYYLGGWYNSKKDLWELETSANIIDRKTAIAFGRLFNQVSIWDLNKSKEIKL